MILRLLSRLLSPRKPRGGDTLGGSAADPLAEWEKQVDAWLAPLTTDPNLSEQLAFLRRLLRENPADALDSVAVSAKALYQAFRESLAPGDLAFFVERVVATSTAEEIARHRDLVACLARLYGEEAPGRVLPLLDARLAQREEQRLATVLGTDAATGEAVAIPFAGRFQGVYCVGATGTGKTTLLLQMILSDICLKRGVCLVEPHGELVRAVIAGMPKERLGDVLYLDLTDSTSAFGLNFFEVEPGADATQVAKVASFVMHLFEAVWEVGPETPRLAQVLRNTTRVMIENQGMTFAEIGLLLWDDGVREKLVRRVTNPQTRLFFQQYNRKSPRDREELIASTMNKVDSYLNEPLVARIVSQSASTINVRRIMDEGKILLVHLSPQLEEPSRLIGALILGRLLMAAFSRADTAPEKRRSFIIYINKYQRFATSDFAVFLAEARKSRVATTIAHQTLEQLSDLNRATALQAGTIVALRVSGADSKDLAPSFDTTPTQTIVGEEPIRAVIADPVSHLVRHGHPHPTVAKFVADYLLPLEALLRKIGAYHLPFAFGCMRVRNFDVINGRSLLTDSLAACMRTGKADLCIHPLALLILGGAVDDGVTEIFYPHQKCGLLPPQEFPGLEDSANYFGHPSLLDNRRAVETILTKYAKKKYWDSVTRSRMVYPGPSFVRMLTSLRQTLEVLCKEPLMTDTGLFQPKYQLRTYSDQENMVANELSQLPNYTAKVRLLSGEHLIKTNPAPSLLPEQEVEARIQAIKERMLRDGVTIPAAAVEEAVRKRHEALRSRPPGNGPQGNGTGRVKPPPKLA
jgi:hypothetical protein